MIRLLATAALAVLLGLAAPGARDARAQGANTQTAIFAGGCFWCMEQAFDEVPGVVETVSGYTGGSVDNPTYKQVSAGGTGHHESVLVRFNPARVSYEELLDAYWHNVDPFDGGGQFCDRGESYKSTVYVDGKEQNDAAQLSKQRVQKQFNKTVETTVVPASRFWPAEDYHQDYHNKNPLQYKFYKWNCGRAQRLEEIWGPKAG